MENNRQTKLLYIAGISPRSGTNFLYKCISYHPACLPTTEGEDHFLRNSDCLIDFATSVYDKWNTGWPIRKKNVPEDLLSSLGTGLVHFLRDQSRDFSSSGNGKHQFILVAKTPHVHNVGVFPKIFPDGFLLILLRDGRAVAESTMQTWGTGFDGAVKRWRKGARKVINFTDCHGMSSEWHQVVRYEDLVRAPKKTLKEVFASADLDAESYPYNELDEMPVLHSSTYGDDEVWGEKKKKEDFDPLSRFASWTKAQHHRFNWLAETELRELGYAPEHTSPSRLDAARQVLTDGRRVLGTIKRSLFRSFSL